MFEIITKRGVSTLASDDSSVTLPYQPNDSTEIGNHFVTVLASWWEPDTEFWNKLDEALGGKDDTKPPKKGLRFDLENPYRNVVGFDADAEPVWIIPKAPHDPPDDVEPYYMSLWTADDELWVRNKNQRAYRVDPASGDLLEDVPANHLRLGGRTIEFDRGWVGKVLHHDDLVTVMLEGSGHPGPSGENIYGFDTDGTRRWWIGDFLDEEEPPAAPPFTNIWIDEGDLWGYATDGYAYQFDIETGELLDTEWRG